MSSEPSRFDVERAVLRAQKDTAMTRIRELLERLEPDERGEYEQDLVELAEMRGRLAERLEQVDELLLAMSQSRLDEERGEG